MMSISERECDERFPYRVYKTNDNIYLVAEIRQPIINSWMFVLSFKNKEDAFKYTTTLNNSKDIATTSDDFFKKSTKKEKNDFFEVKSELELAESCALDYVSSDKLKNLIKNHFHNIYSILLSDYNKRIDMDEVKKEADELGILVPDVLSLEPCLAKDIFDAVKSCDLDFEKIAKKMKKDREAYENSSDTRRFR